MTALLITVDTELSALLHKRGVGLQDNVQRSIWGVVGDRRYGIGWQMDQLDRHGLKGVFFVDPMPAAVYGSDFLKPIVAAILARGHEVQLHVHTEWLESSPLFPTKGQQGRNIGDFSLGDQVTIMRTGLRWLEEAGASAVTAFRAGNFGANEDTLRALAQLGIRWDSSLNPAYRRYGCALAETAGDQTGISRRFGVAELPVAGIWDRPDNFRPAQVCAMSATEMRAGLRHAVREGHDAFTVVTHSFEMLSRDRQRPNRAVMRRFVALCREAATRNGVRSVGFADLSPDLAARAGKPLSRLAPCRWRTGSRIAQQVWATWRYERRLRPA